MDTTTGGGSIPTSSLYAAAIAVVSGGYSVLVATGGWTGSIGVWIMLLVGVVALVHGVALVTPAAARLGAWSGPLMIAYALVMLLNRAVFPMGGMGTAGMGSGGMGAGGMGSGGMMGGYLGTMGQSGGAGMVALALLMLASGIIMTARSEGAM